MDPALTESKQGPAYNEFGYYEQSAITNNFFLRKEHFWSI